MATAVPVSVLIQQHSTNTVAVTDMVSQSKKSWAEAYAPISRLRVHTFERGDGAVIADFNDAFLPAYEDDNLRLAELAFPPNTREYRLYSERDAATWFHSEISNIDTSVVIGEFKRNLIIPKRWQTGDLSGAVAQSKLSQELRGYAHMYQCPHVFCFDQASFLMLQFRTSSLDALSRDCEVDCWVIPRENPNGTSIREALYRLLVQGFRRFQGQYRMPTYSPHSIELFSGQPLYASEEGLTANPGGWRRQVHAQTGAFYWVDAQGNTVTDHNGNVGWDTMSMW